MTDHFQGNDECQNCVHRKVCKLYDEYQAAINAVSEQFVPLEDRRSIRLSDIPWVSVSVHCVHCMLDTHLARTAVAYECAHACSAN